MTQKEEALKLIREIITPISTTLKGNQVLLEDVVCRAQNLPPEGVSDGSMTVAEWLKFRNINNALHDLITAITTSPEGHHQKQLDSQSDMKNLTRDSYGWGIF